MLAEPLARFIGPDELVAIRRLRESLSVDVTQTHQFWESLVARITTGLLTSHQCPWDIEIGQRRVEVKSSREFRCRFNNGVREVFKFGRPHGCGESGKPIHALVLIGLDANEAVHCWVIPAHEVSSTASITLTSPRIRVNGGGRGYDAFQCPPSQLLPEILRACHLTYDAKHHAESAYMSRRCAITRDWIGDVA